MALNEIRCQNCGRLLFKIEYGLIQTKCYRCGAYNIIEFQPEGNNIKKVLAKTEVLDYLLKNQDII